ncbi:polyprotein [Clonorchis sinensis]|uniref:Polyprotein n=1 Tax=Clonorchis sinensis TaxID=79923 RepID=G7YWG2_CLOSI|nr:polyprotein [Clonorchis sinensis]
MTQVNTGCLLQLSMDHNRCGRSGYPSNVRRVMQCHTCKAWWFFRCTGLQNGQASQVGNSPNPFVCASCLHLKGAMHSAIKGELRSPMLNREGECECSVLIGTLDAKLAFLSKALEDKNTKNIATWTKVDNEPSSLNEYLALTIPDPLAAKKVIQLSDVTIKATTASLVEGSMKESSLVISVLSSRKITSTKLNQSFLVSVLTKPDHQSLHADWLRQKERKRKPGLLVIMSPHWPYKRSWSGPPAFKRPTHQRSGVYPRLALQRRESWATAVRNRLLLGVHSTDPKLMAEPMTIKAQHWTPHPSHNFLGWTESDMRRPAAKPTNEATVSVDLDIEECCGNPTATENVKLPIFSSTRSRVAPSSVDTVVVQNPDKKSHKPATSNLGILRRPVRSFFAFFCDALWAGIPPRRSDAVFLDVVYRVLQKMTRSSCKPVSNSPPAVQKYEHVRHARTVFEEPELRWQVKMFDTKMLKDGPLRNAFQHLEHTLVSETTLRDFKNGDRYTGVDNRYAIDATGLDKATAEMSSEPRFQISSEENHVHLEYADISLIFKEGERAQLKGRVYQAVVRAVLLYGCEIQPVQAAKLRRLQVFDSRYFRTIARVGLCRRIRQLENDCLVAHQGLPLKNVSSTRRRMRSVYPRAQVYTTWSYD